MFHSYDCSIKKICDSQFNAYDNMLTDNSAYYNTGMGVGFNSILINVCPTLFPSLLKCLNAYSYKLKMYIHDLRLQRRIAIKARI